LKKLLHKLHKMGTIKHRLDSRRPSKVQRLACW